MTKNGIFLITWHNSSGISLYAIKKIIPNVKIFSAGALKRKDLVTIPLKYNPGVGLIKIAKYLERKTPVLHTFEGIIGKKILDYDFCGIKLKVAEGSLEIINKYKHLVVPVTAYLNDKNEFDIYFGEKIFRTMEFEELHNQEILNKLFDYFINDLKKHKPAQVSIDYYLELNSLG